MRTDIKDAITGKLLSTIINEGGLVLDFREPTGPIASPDYDEVVKELESRQLGEGLSPSEPFTPQKTSGGYGSLSFSTDAAELAWEIWASGYADDGIVIQPKIDGWRLSASKRGDKVWMFSEDAKRNIASKLPLVAEDLKALKPSSLILDGELVLYAEEAVSLNNDYKVGGKIERMDMPSFLVADKPIAKFRPSYLAFDLLYKDGKDLHELPQDERLKLLHEVLNPVDTKVVKEIESRTISSKSEFLKAVKWASELPNMEGAMLKVASSSYSLSGKSRFIAKLKNFKELKDRKSVV